MVRSSLDQIRFACQGRFGHGKLCAAGDTLFCEVLPRMAIIPSRPRLVAKSANCGDSEGGWDWGRRVDEKRKPSHDAATLNGSAT